MGRLAEERRDGLSPDLALRAFSKAAIEAMDDALRHRRQTVGSLEAERALLHSTDASVKARVQVPNLRARLSLMLQTDTVELIPTSIEFRGHSRATHFLFWRPQIVCRFPHQVTRERSSSTSRSAAASSRRLSVATRTATTSSTRASALLFISSGRAPKPTSWTASIPPRTFCTGGFTSQGLEARGADLAGLYIDDADGDARTSSNSCHPGRLASRLLLVIGCGVMSQGLADLVSRAMGTRVTACQIRIGLCKGMLSSTTLAGIQLCAWAADD